MTQPLDQWIAASEGLRLRPYNDMHGFLTIGYGHNLSSNGISIAIADMLLDADIASAQKDVIRNLPWVLNASEPRQDAFVHLCFWIGIGSLLGFTKMLAAARDGDWDTAVQELLNSALHADIPGRCEDIANRLLTGE